MKPLLAFFVDSRLLAAGGLLWPAICAAAHASGLGGKPVGAMLVCGLAGFLAASTWRAITRP